jgi:hypothetical protein
MWTHIFLGYQVQGADSEEIMAYTVDGTLDDQTNELTAGAAERCGKSYLRHLQRCNAVGMDPFGPILTPSQREAYRSEKLMSASADDELREAIAAEEAFGENVRGW